MPTREEEKLIADAIAEIRNVGNGLNGSSLSSNRSYSSYSSRKEGRAISRSNADVIKTHVDSLHKAADLLHGAADDLATILQGSETPYAGSDPGTPDDGQQEGKSHYGRYSAAQGYEVKAFDSGVTVEKAQKSVGSLGLPHGASDWIASRFYKSMEAKMSIK